MFTFNKKSIIGYAALLMALAACSNIDDKPLSIGGASEETDEIANRDTSTTDWKDTSSTDNKDTPSIQKTVHFKPAPQDNATEPGNITGTQTDYQYPELALMYELDSTRLTPTGKVIASIDFDLQESSLGEESIFHFDSIPFESPYVIVELEYRNKNNFTAKRAIVDIRDTGDININALTHIVSYRMELQAYTINTDNKTIAEIKHEAERSLLDAIGFNDYFYDFEKPGTFDDSIHILIEHLFDELLANVKDVVNKFGYDDSFEKLDFNIFQSFLGKYEHFEQLYPELIASQNELGLKYYQHQKTIYDLYINAFATPLGAGRCTSSREGDTVDTYYLNNFLIACTDESWKLIRKPIPHTFDSLVDPRDGNVYKTVTIDMGGTSQTWMAENLAYNADSSICTQGLPESLRNDPFYCRFYGRSYSPATVFAIDSSYYRAPTFEDCNAFHHTYFNGPIDTADYLSKCAKETQVIDWAKIASDSSLTKQGICPDGWRIPSYEDWEKLIKYVSKTYDIEKTNSEYFYSLFGNPTGFNVRHLMVPSNKPSNTLEFWKRNEVWLFATWPHKTENDNIVALLALHDAKIGYGIMDNYKEDSDDSIREAVTITYNSLYNHVRCIKND